MLAAIGRSLPSYIAGVRCWAAFVDALGRARHFPAREGDVIRRAAMFRQCGTLKACLTNLRWAHRFLRFRNDWDTDAVRQ
eukprot:932234-Pyramimonas_sp.AAC.1